ncbi:DUF1115 domain protein [Aspergillus uvarum CBS 121591]|uniref:DUF1115 domain protein n=1 Tax=Aspergillus uvarum CBS 121591 TaxID=1448315 RepID=A0A319CKS4_9EURO|nr:DUF1115 domain protein [Aspergillus uvarum CBS 121591]PYH86175.1 DUF1115 domain protein [Aspergillus uvarum CBS 121591]
MATIPEHPTTVLPVDLMEMQLSTIDLLTAMYASPEELEIPPASAECLEKLRAWCEDPNPTSAPSGIPTSISLYISLPLADSDKRFQVNLTIPLHCDQPGQALDQPPPPTYSLRPDWLSKADVAKLAAAIPADADVFEALTHIQEQAVQLLASAQQEASSNPPCTSESAARGPLVRVWFYFPSLSTRAKRDDLVNHAPEYALTGFVLAGKPGVLCLEGASADIDAYMKFIKTHSWGDIPSHQKKVSERFRETGAAVQRVFTGMEEITDSLGERSGQRANRGDMQALEQWLHARGLGDAFEMVIF